MPSKFTEAMIRKTQVCERAWAVLQAMLMGGGCFDDDAYVIAEKSFAIADAFDAIAVSRGDLEIVPMPAPPS